MRNVVDLPQPDGPKRTVMEPCGMVSDTSCTTAWPAYDLERPESSIMQRGFAQ